MTNDQQILVVGIGNEYMGDDGVGVYVIEALQQQSLTYIACRNCGTDLLRIASENRPYQSVIIVDAVRVGDKPGSIHWFAPVDVSSHSASQSVHQLSLIDNVLLLPLMNFHFKQTQFYFVGIEPGNLHQRLGLSPPVQKSADSLADLLGTESGVEQVIENCKRVTAV